MRCFGIIVAVLMYMGMTPTGVAQTNTVIATANPVSAEQVEYTHQELSEYGFTPTDLTTYQEKLTTTAGRWWGQLSPMELMMYSATSDQERKRFARMYLSSLHPKSLAERDAAVAMYQVARELAKEQQGLLQGSRPISKPSKRAALFVRLDCQSCKTDVVELVAASDQKLDIYLTQLNPEKNTKEQLVGWARSMQLPPHKVTLNDDQGIYQRRFNKPLERLQLVTQ